MPQTMSRAPARFAPHGMRRVRCMWFLVTYSPCMRWIKASVITRRPCRPAHLSVQGVCERAEHTATSLSLVLHAREQSCCAHTERLVCTWPCGRHDVLHDGRAAGARIPLRACGGRRRAPVCGPRGGGRRGAAGAGRRLSCGRAAGCCAAVAVVRLSAQRGSAGARCPPRGGVRLIAMSRVYCAPDHQVFGREYQHLGHAHTFFCLYNCPRHMCRAPVLSRMKAHLAHSYNFRVHVS